jgi:UDP-2,3-diacylglucosamine pyrophosphatase LpxH
MFERHDRNASPVKLQGLDIAANVIYVVSDLHLGNGSAKDHMVCGEREELLHRFLDEVERRDGRLIILGDLLDLWRFRLEDVVARWGPVLDRFEALGADYVTGNHDARLCEDLAGCAWHPLFKRLRSPFSEQIGERCFRFMHGHEIDPFMPAILDRWAPLLEQMVALVYGRPSLSLASPDAMTDTMLEWGETLLHLGYRRHHRLWTQIQREFLQWPDHGWRRVKAPFRTRHMLSRFYRDRSQGLYDVAVAGHTHRAGHFSHWYLNSGCWIKPVASFLKIYADGQAIVCDWRREGERRNPACVWTRCLRGWTE